MELPSDRVCCGKRSHGSSAQVTRAQGFPAQDPENKKLLPKEKAEDIADQLVTIEITKKRLANAIAKGKPAMTFRIQDSEAFAGPETPPESFYELTSTSKLPPL